jgi:hypothetical protein
MPGSIRCPPLSPWSLVRHRGTKDDARLQGERTAIALNYDITYYSAIDCDIIMAGFAVESSSGFAALARPK